jgi:transposase-like protein
MSKTHESVEVCKYCGCKHLVKNGSGNRAKKQSYKCKRRKKTFIIGDKRIKHSSIVFLPYEVKF